MVVERNIDTTHFSSLALDYRFSKASPRLRVWLPIVNSPRIRIGFPFYVKKLFTRNTVTDVTDGYYVEITVVRRNKNMRNYVMKLLRETIKNRNYVTLWRIRKLRSKNRGFYCGKYPLMVVSAVSFN